MQGVMLWTNIFELEPAALDLFSFTDLPDLYDSAALKKHGSTMIMTVNSALSDFDLAEESLVNMGARHFDLGIKMPQYDIVGQAML